LAIIKKDDGNESDDDFNYNR